MEFKVTRSWDETGPRTCYETAIVEAATEEQAIELLEEITPTDIRYEYPDGNPEITNQTDWKAERVKPVEF
jgi:hypothetical protein